MANLYMERIERLGSTEGCIVCQGRQCFCAVTSQLREMQCLHGGSRGICPGCLAEALMTALRGDARAVYTVSRTLTAAMRVNQRRERAARRAQEAK